MDILYSFFLYSGFVGFIGKVFNEIVMIVKAFEEYTLSFTRVFPIGFFMARF